ncbi:MAG: DNA helicase RecQ [Treponema sp.]|nr:DNA helicase RecQ [Treponema sp.]
MKINSRTFENAAPELVLKTVFGYDSFRPNQKDIINSVLSGKDTLAIMPTGGGKSICYQIPALIFDGITVVVSPLISLMQDQVASLEASGIHAVFLNSTLDWESYKTAVNDIKAGLVKLVYLSPEALATGRTREILTDPFVKVSCITIDEAHCISSWGHDFRTDYLEIAGVRALLPESVMLALTATATEQVRLDIVKNLRMKKAQIFLSSFNRSNIFLEVQPRRNALDQIVAYIKKHHGESGIIYCGSRRQVDELTGNLDKMGYSVINYHAGLTDDVRAKNQALFIRDEIQIMVATVAFGMGIDKPNVRFVINYDLPKSVEEYYQEIGRAGRDGLASSALLLYSAGDIQRNRFFFAEAANPEKSERLLQEMVRFASGRTCRRKALLSYFGEKFVHKNEEEKNCCCDICKITDGKGELPLNDLTIPVQKLLCCIIRTKERFGATYVIEVLLGSRNKRIVENGHNMISTWGIGRELSKEEWMDLVDILAAEDYIARSGEYNVLVIGEKGRECLASREKVMLPFEFSGSGSSAMAFPKKSSMPGYVLHKKTEKVIAERPDQNDDEAERIIEDLRNWRKRKADDMNVPPYVIFNDKTLYDLGAKKPTDKTALLNVYGIGQAKADQFGKSILSIIRND